VSEGTFEVVERARRFSEFSGGAFDITFNVMWGVWDFKQRPPTLPDPAEIGRRLPLIDYRDVVLDRRARTIELRRKGMKIGLGGIGKGCAVDRVCALLESEGVTNYIVSGGGDVRVAGSRGKTPWRLGVQHPRKESLLYVLDMTDVAIATSGDYERYFILDGKRYHHILDPKTGYPASGLSSVTLIAPEAMDADALSTSVFVLGARKGLELLEGLPGVEGIVIDDHMQHSMTAGLRVLRDESGSTPTIRLTRDRVEEASR
jgi:thiamine biosynthesis lipoprotein